MLPKFGATLYMIKCNVSNHDFYLFIYLFIHSLSTSLFFFILLSPAPYRNQSTDSCWKSIDWVVHDMSYYRKIFLNRRYVKIKINPKNQKLTRESCENRRSCMPNQTIAEAVLLKHIRFPHKAVERLNF